MYDTRPIILTTLPYFVWVTPPLLLLVINNFRKYFIPSITMSDLGSRNALMKIMIEKALWNCCVSLSLTEIMPNLYLGG